MKVRKVKFHFQDKYPMDEIEKKIDDQVYYLVPGADQASHYYYQKKHSYDELDNVSQQMFTRKNENHKTDINDKHHAHLKHLIPQELCEILIKQAQTDKSALAHPELMNKLLPLILNEETDKLFCSYFESEYSLLCYNFCESDPNEETPPYSNSWHCDGGPEKMLKILVYLNGYDEHHGNTKFMDIKATNKLKKAGFIFGDITKRAQDIHPLCLRENITPEISMYENIDAGDGLLFNQNKLAHIRKKPEKAPRHMLQMCFIQSPFHWRFTHDKILPPKSHLIGFEGAAEILLSHTNRQLNDNEAVVMFPASGNITSQPQLKLLLNNIFSDSHFSGEMFKRLTELDPNLAQINSVNILLDILKSSFKDSINWQGELGIENIQNLTQLANYETELVDSINRYIIKNKPIPEAMSWPNPTSDTAPSSKYQQQPFVLKHPIFDANTKIGSAGSCFAFEIARILQKQGFNYLVTERNDDPNSGIIIDGYTPGDKYARFSANYGILFNTPSFKQLAERAFAVKPTKKLLFQQSDGHWLDPYRENVMFCDHQAYLNDYQRHLDATRNALEQVEVFIITLGLNECWQFRDGSVMSRNPRFNTYPLVTHKTLTVQENIDNIQAFYDIIKQHNPDFKLIISVSPIPFMVTGHAKEKHVISANCHSKAVLRVAAEQLVHNNSDMYYLPSYEMVTECLKEPWAEDQRHVTKETVEQVVKLFRSIFEKTD
ncbi:GSCFA domain-containing protein [Colwelliaceae bacterium 6441]